MLRISIIYIFSTLFLLIMKADEFILEDFQTKSHIDNNFKNPTTLFSNSYGQWKGL